MVSRKHFQMIANQLRAERPVMLNKSPTATQWRKDVEAIAKGLAELNPRFDYARFYKACGLDEDKKAA